MKYKKTFNRNDLSLDYVTVFESKKRGDICVPPPTKPEGVTTQEMMDYIKKNTLYILIKIWKNTKKMNQVGLKKHI